LLPMPYQHIGETHCLVVAVSLSYGDWLNISFEDS